METDENVTLSKRISGDQDGDAALFGGVLTNHSDRLFAMTKSPDVTIRYAVLEVLGLLLRQGLVNPNEAVPHLFALQGDIENDNIRSLALQFLSAEGEKRPDTLRRRICAGVKQAFEFQRVVCTRIGQVSATVVVKNGRESNIECIFSSVFRECIGNIRKQRHGFFKNLLSLFKLKTDSRGQKAEGKDLALLSFVSQILAHLEYRSADDPLFIIHEITSMVTLQGAETLDKMAAVLRKVGLASSDECDDDIAIEDALERASRSKFPSRTNEAHPLAANSFDMPQFVSLCQDGMAFGLVLRLKSFLRRAYNLSETRCLEYDPSATERICDKGAPKAVTSKPFNASVPQVLHATGRVDIDALIRQYAEFRQLMREENNVEIASGGSGDDSNDDDGHATKRQVDEI
jgi:cohesin loading factor subunit SCC2